MRFASWRDYYIFLNDYVRFSCLNCRHSGDGLDLSVEHTDHDYASLFCSFNINMVRLDFQTICVEWEDLDGHKLPVDDEWNFKFPQGLDEMFEVDDDKKWTIEEIREVIENYESE